MKKPNITIEAENMIYAQAAKLSKGSRKDIDAWADSVEARRLARGEDPEGARPDRFEVPVKDRNGTLIGHIAFQIC